ncbi:hypothetical protein LOD99_3252 [Oopsacas minuta]|uniref:Tripartite motif-containing protein 2 n=1 Tax=Oopsacas minuta TaxID=111878 RepID=A0AAV7JXI2_9METZ|nr:hypothetical protein LOD99_3252 [Oopsacas minuta]
MACNDPQFENDDFDSLDESQMTLMQPGNQAESMITLFRERMDLERQAMTRNFAHVRDLIDTCERDFTDRFDQACVELEREIGERELQLKSIQQTLQEMSLSMKENSLITTLQVAQQPLLTKLQQLENEIAVLSDLKVNSDTQGIEQSLRQFGNLNNPIEELEFKDAIPIPEIKHVSMDNSVAPVLPKLFEQNGNHRPYTDLTHCVWVRFRSDSSTEGIINPRGIAVCKETGTIFVADHGNHRIQVCTPDGEYIRSIIHRDLSYPIYIVVSHNSKEIFVTSHYALIKFTFEGEFLAKCPVSKSAYRGLDQDDNGLLYACEWRNYIVVIHDPDTLKVMKRFKLQTIDISDRRKLNYIRICGDLIYVLFAHNGFWNNFSYREFPLQIYNKNGDHIRSIAGGNMLQKPVCFAIDGEGNCLVTDYWKHTVVVVSGTGALVGHISQCGQGRDDMSYPTGICLTKEGTVLVVSTGKTDGLLQAF